MKYVVMMFGLWMAGLVATKYLERQVSACPVTIEIPRQPYQPTDNTLETIPRVMSGTPVVYRF